MIGVAFVARRVAPACRRVPRGSCTLDDYLALGVLCQRHRSRDLELVDNTDSPTEFSYRGVGTMQLL